MTWKVQDCVSQRIEFVMLALAPNSNIRDLCRRFGVSPKTAYKWLERYRIGGREALGDLSRRPRSTPGKTDSAMEDRVLKLRKDTQWGARKIHHRLIELGESDVPAPSTITDILRRRGEILPEESLKHKTFERFEHPRPNDLWQMDFKGHFPMSVGRCHPLTVLDDHSRYAVGLRACGNERGEGVRCVLTDLFRRYGLPARMLMDNGSPWGNDSRHPWTPLTVWLTRLGVRVTHGRPYHPQTQGKAERFHRTLKAELLGRESFSDLAHAQQRLDAWREVYNTERPHEALEMKTPISRYQPSPRAFPEHLPPIEYWPGDAVRLVQQCGEISYAGRLLRIPRALYGQPVALRPTDTDGLVEIFYCTRRICRINLKVEKVEEESIDSSTHIDDHESR